MFTLDRKCQPRLTPRLTLPVSGEHSVLSPTEGCDIYILLHHTIYLQYSLMKRQEGNNFYCLMVMSPSHGNVTLTW